MRELIDKNGQFCCTICGGYHKYETSIHIPIPKIIDDIRRGDKDIDFEILSKNLFFINKEFLYALGIIESPIIDDEYGDCFDQYIWVKIDKQEFRSKFMKIKEGNERLEFSAIIDRLLPYYGNDSQLTVVLEVNMAETIPLEILDIKTSNSLIVKHLKEGVMTAEVIRILESVIHTSD